jgi:hypothetical protein
MRDEPIVVPQVIDYASQLNAYVPPLDINTQLVVNEPNIISLCADLVGKNPTFEQVLRGVLQQSKHDPNVAIAAANSITILVAAKVSFIDNNLRGIRIRGANLSGGYFDGADLQETDFRDVNFLHTRLNRANLSGSCFDGIQIEAMLNDNMDTRAVEANGCQILNAHGLAPDQQTLFEREGAQIQCSTRSSDYIIAQRNQISFPVHHRRGVFSSSHIVSPDVWLVSVARERVGHATQHAFLILESIENDYYRIRRFDFVKELRQEMLPNGISPTALFGQGLIEVADKSVADAEHLASLCISTSVNITNEQGNQLLINIQSDQRRRLGYCNMGSSALYGMFRLPGTREQHNCISWCQHHLVEIGINVMEDSVSDLLFQSAIRKLPDGNSQTNFHNGDDPEGNCLIM